MTNHDHERALELIMRRGTEDLAARDVDWLNAHLAANVQSVRAMPTTSRDRAPVAGGDGQPRRWWRTQQRVHARAL